MLKKLRLPCLVFLTSALMFPPAILAADAQPGSKPLVVPIAGVGSAGVTFTGNVAIQRFVQRDGHIFAVGTVSGTVSGPDGPIGTSLLLPVAFPVQVNGGTVPRPEATPSSSLAPRNSPARLVFVQATTCGVLHLDLGAVNLNLLGAVVTTTPVTIDINGDTSGPLGNLVCTALNLVNNVVGLVNVLNSILGLVTGLLGGLTGGLGGAAVL